MEHQGLRAKDLIPYIGSASKVSEVLSGQRELSKAMIRNLVNGLGIPAEVLLREPGAKLSPDEELSKISEFPATATTYHRRIITKFTSGRVAEEPPET